MVEWFNGELEWIWGVAVVVYPGIFLEGLRKTTKSVLRPRFKWGTARLLVKSVAAVPTRFISLNYFL
jgi:hypothetical protein